MADFGLLFYSSIFDAVDPLSAKNRLEFYDNLFRWYFKAEEPSFKSQITKSVFLTVKPAIEKSRKRYETCVSNGSKGGAPIGNSNAKK